MLSLNHLFMRKQLIYFLECFKLAGPCEKLLFLGLSQAAQYAKFRSTFNEQTINSFSA
jgi:hypothetical protein